jgi:hypothetical protein
VMGRAAQRSLAENRPIQLKEIEQTLGDTW